MVILSAAFHLAIFVYEQMIARSTVHLKERHRSRLVQIVTVKLRLLHLFLARIRKRVGCT